MRDSNKNSMRFSKISSYESLTRFLLTQTLLRKGIYKDQALLIYGSLIQLAFLGSFAHIVGCIILGRNFTNENV